MKSKSFASHFRKMRCDKASTNDIYKEVLCVSVGFCCHHIFKSNRHFHSTYRHGRNVIGGHGKDSHD